VLSVCHQSCNKKILNDDAQIFISRYNNLYLHHLHSDFHCEQCWERWLRKADNGLQHQREEVLSLLRDVARSATEDVFNRNLKSLKASDLWMSNPQLRNWFEKTWLPEAKVQLHYRKKSTKTKEN